MLTGISFGSRSTSTGPQAYAVTSSVDGFTSTLAAGALSNNSTWTTTGQQALNVVGLAGVPVILRIYGFNGTGTPSLNTANWRVDDLTLYTTPLPIKLISFDATVNAGTVRLKWLTGEETDGGKIVIEKAGDSRNFTEIGEVAAKNGLENSYSFEDALSTGNSYYRLKLVDKNGSFAYSNTVAVKGKATTSISLFPNPAASTLRINMGKKATYSSYRIVGIDGRVAMTADFPEGNSEIVVDLAGLTKGRYLISLEGNSGQESHSFIKE
ncbi:MAG: T9SS type A sorting domain-containing protein [Chitinophagaceae bacterium]|nr:MAG: T9SS type A sorting domain-containing protein [Chitinophagaceae bacterium]